MKRVQQYITLSVLLVAMVLLSVSFKNKLTMQTTITGAWHLQNGDEEQVLLFSDGYSTHTTYSKAAKNFGQTNGGTYEVSNGTLTINKEFDTKDKERVGKVETYKVAVDDKRMTLEKDGSKTTWTRLDNGTENLAGTWKITGRKQDGNLTQIHQTGPRKTIKVLTGTRFQWAAINPATKEFFGTGGGTYTFTGGKYTEHIEFFSRDNNRVGAALIFDGELKDGAWHHSGKSSAGADIYEIWSRITKLK